MKIQWQKHHHISEYRSGSVWESRDHNDAKVGPHVEGGARILINESFIKAIEMCQV